MRRELRPLFRASGSLLRPFPVRLRGKIYCERLSLEMTSRRTPKARRAVTEQLCFQPGQSSVWTN